MRRRSHQHHHHQQLPPPPPPSSSSSSPLAPLTRQSVISPWMQWRLPLHPTPTNTNK